MADKKIEPKVVKPKFKSENELIRFLKFADLKPAEKQKLLDDFRKGG